MLALLFASAALASDSTVWDFGTLDYGWDASSYEWSWDAWTWDWSYYYVYEEPVVVDPKEVLVVEVDSWWAEGVCWSAVKDYVGYVEDVAGPYFKSAESGTCDTVFTSSALDVRDMVQAECSDVGVSAWGFEEFSRAEELRWYYMNAWEPCLSEATVSDGKGATDVSGE
jgi:hypothetical protein